MAVDYKRELYAIIEILLQEKASDLHFSVDSHPLIRVSGSLIPLVKKPILTASDIAGFAKALMREDQHKRYIEFNEVDFSSKVQKVFVFEVMLFINEVAWGLRSASFLM